MPPNRVKVLPLNLDKNGGLVIRQNLKQEILAPMEINWISNDVIGKTINTSDIANNTILGELDDASKLDCPGNVSILSALSLLPSDTEAAQGRVGTSVIKSNTCAISLLTEEALYFFPAYDSPQLISLPSPPVDVQVGDFKIAIYERDPL